MAQEIVNRISYDKNTLSPEKGVEAFQWWYFDAEFENGYSATLVILPMSIGIINGLEMDASSPVAWITITTPDGRTYSEKKSYQAADLKAAVKGLDAQLGPNTIRFDSASYILHFAEGDLGADLVMTPNELQWSPLGEESRLEKEVMEAFGLNPDYFFDYVEFMPRGTAKGSISINGEKVEVKGIGYHEQGYGNFHLGSMMDTWFWSKYYLDEYTLILCGINLCEHLGGAKIYGVMLARGEKIIESYLDLMGMLIDFNEEECNIIEKTGERYPSKIKISLETDNVALEVKIKYLYLRDSWEFSYPPETLQTRHTPTWLQYTSEIEAEIAIDGKKEIKKGKGVYEAMLSG